MIHNGFFYQENAHDQVKIKLGISKSERLYAMKAEVLAQAAIPVYVQLSTIDGQLVSQESVLNSSKAASCMSPCLLLLVKSL